MIRKLLIVAEVALILGLFFYLRGILGRSGFGDWQEPLFGRAILSSCLLLFVLPLSTRFVTGLTPGAYGLAAGDLGAHARLALQAAAFVMPATMLFPVVGVLGMDPMHWLGGSFLALGFGVSGVFMVRNTRRTPNIAGAPPSNASFSGYVGLLLGGVALCYVLQPLSAVMTGIVTMLIFVGFLEEFFFRGYVQTRFNEVFARPYSLFNVNYGAGLILAAVIFGLFHPLSVAGENPRPWALWTGVFGLIFGFLREKSGAVVTPALVHGAMLLPRVFFGD